MEQQDQTQWMTEEEILDAEINEFIEAAYQAMVEWVV